MSAAGRLDRRTLLKRGGLLVLGASLPLPLTACGKTIHVEPERWIGFVYAGGPVDEASMPLNPPLGDLARVMTGRAKERQVSFAVTSKNPSRSLGTYVAPTEFDPATGKRPPRYPVVAVSVPGITLDPGAVRAIEGGVRLVSFLFPVPRAAAAITVDPARMGKMLAEDILAWVRGKGGDVEALVVERKPPSPYTPTPFTATERRSGAALRSVLAAAGPGLRIAATVSVANEDSEDGIRAERVVRDALAVHPRVRIVACLDDSAALGAARALGSARGSEAADLYVGGLGAPSATSQRTLDALEGPGCLRTLVAASPRALAEALVEVSAALLDGEEAESVAVPPLALRRGSAALRDYGRDYKKGGYLGPNEYESFFVINPPERQPEVSVGPRRASQ